MLGDLFVLTLGMALLIGGGEALVRGSASLARALGVSALVIGMTVVSFGTSAPELAVNVMAAAEGNGALSFGNIVGSNLANIGLIVASAALLRPLAIRSVVLLRELPMMLLATAVVCVFALDASLNSRTALIDRSDGLVLLLVFTVFLYYTLNEFVVQRRSRRLAPTHGGTGVPAVIEENGDDTSVARVMRPGSALLLAVFGAVILVLGARATVLGATGLARTLGVPEVVIGLTVIAIGTSLPELVASIVAAYRGQADIAVGNVVGSNIFNLLLVGGACSAVQPIPVPEGGLGDLAMLVALSVLLWLVSASRSRVIIRAEGAALMLLYVAYLGFRLP